MALPEGATRGNVTLTVTEDEALRVTLTRAGQRPISKEVRLPRDAVLSDVSARFEAEEARGGEESPAASEVAVSGLEAVVGRADAAEPKQIEIL